MVTDLQSKTEHKRDCDTGPHVERNSAEASGKTVCDLRTLKFLTQKKKHKQGNMNQSVGANAEEKIKDQSTSTAGSRRGLTIRLRIIGTRTQRR